MADMVEQVVARMAVKVVDLATVLDFWAKKYKPTDGSTIVSIDSYVDTSKGKAIFVVNTVKDVPDGSL
jgi:hypothetical protein